MKRDNFSLVVGCVGCKVGRLGGGDRPYIVRKEEISRLFR